MSSSVLSSASPVLLDAAAFRGAGYLAPDVYFAPGYGEAEEAQGAGTWSSVVAFEGRWQLPFHTKSTGGLLDAVTPYGYSGVFAASELTRDERLSAWSEATTLLKSLGYVSLFLRQSSLVPTLDAPSGKAVVRDHPTVLLATKDPEASWKNMQGRSRTSIRKADKAGFTSELAPVRPGDLKRGSVFRQLYESAMTRRNASPRYFFNDAYYDALVDALGDSLLLGITRPSQGEVACAALFMRHGGMMHYHLSGSEASAGRVGATNQLIWAAIQWSSAHGVDALHLGGGVEPGDSLQKFKESFGGTTLGYSAYGVVLDEDRYRLAVRDRAAKIGRSADHVMESSFFPAYRMPA